MTDSSFQRAVLILPADLFSLSSSSPLPVQFYITLVSSRVMRFMASVTNVKVHLAPRLLLYCRIDNLAT